MSSNPDLTAVITYLRQWQDDVCQSLLNFEEKSAQFHQDEWQYPSGGGGITRVFSRGKVFEKAGVNFSHIKGQHLPSAATERKPELTGCAFQATGVSIVIHPDNPFIPTTHANLRFFLAEKPDEGLIWWFGGGFDLTPYYPFLSDCQLWHRYAEQACTPFGSDLYPNFKKWADDYFYLKHRQESRGIGGLFFDEFCHRGFDSAFGFIQSVGQAFLDAYQTIVTARHHHNFTPEQKEFQLIRRGRYVEFNLLYDRGTLFGLQAQGRTESILISLPLHVMWDYNCIPEPNTPEARLTEFYLKPQDWLSMPISPQGEKDVIR